MPYLRTFIYLGWPCFWIYWTILAVRSKQNLVSTRYDRWFRFSAFLLIIIGLRVIYLLHINIDYHLSSYGGLTTALIGFIFFITGLALAIWARIHLGRNWGTPMSQKTEPELITSGPYSSVRHPIYSGILLATFGTALVVNTYWFALLIIGGVYFMYAATQEEKSMAKAFPNVYPTYVHRTKKLIPFIY
ncbi:MAG TPA: isoprenylcysteine carboxylmethyltransferase family protein [Verrucomicrobiae bacterium]|nr:isoprenylcysteine carboxylmethyltransferase family protein [Verrucomicrobiae bacterium]